MTSLLRRLLPLLLLAALVAGCANTGTPGDTGDGGDGGGTATPPAQMSTAEAGTLLRTAASEMPERFGMDMVVSSKGAEVMRMTGAFDNATGEAYIELQGNASAFGEEFAENGAAFFENGFTIYTTTDGALYLANGTAFVFPPDDDSGGLVPSPDEGPFAGFMNPDESFADFDDENVTVKSVTPIVHKNKPAIKLEIATIEDDRTMDATVIVWTSPKRLAHIDTTLPAEDDDDNPLSNATASIDFAYEGDVSIQVSEAAKRAMGIAYKSNKNAFQQDDSPTVWTFQHSGGVALADVEAQVKDSSAMMGSSEDMGDFSKIPTRWTMTLAEGSKSQDGVSLKFTDADGDGKVSMGDTLEITSTGDEPPSVVLYDTVTRTYVVPGFEVALLALALAGAALLSRRR